MDARGDSAFSAEKKQTPEVTDHHPLLTKEEEHSNTLPTLESITQHMKLALNSESKEVDDLEFAKTLREIILPFVNFEDAKEYIEPNLVSNVPLNLSTPNLLLNDDENRHLNLFFNYASLLKEFEEIQSHDALRTRKLPVVLGLVTAAGLLASAGFLLKRFIALPTLFLPQGETYFDTLTTNNVKCGIAFPLTDMCNGANTLNASFIYPSWFCGTLAGDLCPSQEILTSYLTVPQYGLNASCADTYHLFDFSKWKTIMGGAYDCYLTGIDMCKAKNYDLPTYLATVVKNGARKWTCERWLPLENVCDAIAYEVTAQYQCAMDAKLLNERITPFAYQFDKALTVSNQTCATLFPNVTNYCTWPTIFGDGLTCWSKAEALCAEPLVEKSTWWTKQRIIAFTTSIAALLLLLTVGYLLLRKLWNSEKKFGDLPQTFKEKVNKGIEKTNIELNNDSTLISVEYAILQAKKKSDFYNSRSVFFNFSKRSNNANTTVNSVTKIKDINLLLKSYVNTDQVPMGPELAPETPKRRCC